MSGMAGEAIDVLAVEGTVQQVRLGRSGLVVSRLAFGTWQLGGDWGPTNTAEAMDAIRRAVDEGVTFFDTAQAYGFGQSEQLLSRRAAWCSP